MEILIVMAVILILAVCHTKKETKEQKPSVKGAKKEILQINTLLQNVEIYDGTPSGQKRIGGDIK